jgi:glycosyltransferase involved in cell wall biosynthesis
LLAKSLGIDGAVTFAGSQSHAQVAEWLHRARLLVLPSHTPPDGDTEGTPLAILEAAATGLPVVSTRHAGIPEAVLDGQTGLLVDEHDLQGFARAWLELLRSPAQAAEWGSAGRRHIEAHYESTAQHAKLWDVITGKARPTGPDGI